MDKEYKKGKQRKVKGGLKSTGMQNAKWDKMDKQENESAEKAPHDQMSGGSAKSVDSALKGKK